MAKPAKKKTLQPDIARRRAVRRKKLQSPEIGQTTEYDAAGTLDQPPMAGRLPIGLKSRSSPEVLDRLWTIIESRKGADPEVSHSARLLAKGTVRVAQKFGEEAVECLLEAVAGNRTGLIGESADVLYHLLVTWVHAGVHPNEVWQELQRRERVSYLTEGADVPLKRLLASVQIGTSKIP